MDFQTLIEQCDLALRRGEIGLATELLKSLKYSKVPREFRLPLAKLCRRSGLWINGLRLLGKLVRPPEEGHPQATEVEMAEYALLLMKGGAIEEAKYILQNLSPQSVPELEMYQAFCEMAGWNYGETILLLKKYLASATNEYQKLIAKVNLAAALVWEEHTAEASVAVENLIYEAKSSNSLRLLANGLELRSQILIQAGDFEGCRKSLETANKLLSEGSSSDRLFIYKWQAICMALKNKNQQPLQDFRKIAESSLQWESVRECDFFSLRISFDEDLFRHLIMGTPHEPYRIKVCQTLNQAMPEGTFLYGAKDSPYLDLQTGLCTSGASLKGGKKIHQLLPILLRDFYKPVNLWTIFSEMFPDEYYNFLSSPGRVHQVISRCRRFFEINELPVAILQEEAGFKVQISGPFSFLMKLDRVPVAGHLAQIDRLKKLFPPGVATFSAGEVSALLNTSKPTAHRILRWGVTHAQIEKTGRGPSTLYRFVA